MTSISKPSKPNSSTYTRCEMMTGEVSSGLTTPKVHMKPPLPLLRQHNRLLYRNSHPLVLTLPLLPLLLTQNDGSSRSCSATSSIPPDSLPNSTPKSTGKSSVPINRLVLKLLHALTDTLPNSWVTDYLST